MASKRYKSRSQPSKFMRMVRALVSGFSLDGIVVPAQASDKEIRANQEQPRVSAEPHKSQPDQRQSPRQPLQPPFKRVPLAMTRRNPKISDDLIELRGANVPGFIWPEKEGFVPRPFNPDEAKRSKPHGRGRS